MDAEYHRKRRRERRKKFLALLGGRCERCGSKDNLQFDHKDPSQKEFGISRYLNSADDKIRKEVEKCRLLCADCHRVKTREEGDHYYPPSTHGSIWHYKQYKCRCDLCRKAMSDYYHSKKKSKVVAQMDAFHKTCLALSSRVEAWHCGSPLKGGHFSLNFLGGGEGLHYLGPGVYFATSEEIAKRYAKYNKKPVLYKVLIDASEIYNTFTGEPKNILPRWKKLEEDLINEFNVKDYFELKSKVGAGELKYGVDLAGILNKLLGGKEAAQKLVSYGIKGLYEELKSGTQEICVYDTSLIQIIETIPLTEDISVDASIVEEKFLQLLKEGKISSALATAFELSSPPFFFVDDVAYILDVPNMDSDDKFNMVEGLLNKFLTPIIKSFLATNPKNDDEKISRLYDGFIPKTIDELLG